MTVVAASRTGNGLQNRLATVILCIVQECPGALQCRRAQIVSIASDRVACRITYRAIDALYASVGLGSRLGAGVNWCDWIMSGERTMMYAFGHYPLVNEWAHVDDKILDYGQIAQRSNHYFIVDQNL